MTRMRDQIVCHRYTLGRTCVFGTPAITSGAKHKSSASAMNRDPPSDAETQVPQAGDPAPETLPSAPSDAKPVTSAMAPTDATEGYRTRSGRISKRPERFSY